MTGEQQRKVPPDPRDGLHPDHEAGPATVSGGPNDAPAPRTARPEFAGVGQRGASADPPGAGVPQRPPADAAAEAGEVGEGAGSGDRFTVSHAAERLGRALASEDAEAAVADAAPEIRDRLEAQLRELRLDGTSGVAVVRTRARDGGWTVWLQFRGGAKATTIATEWDEAADGPVLRDIIVAGDGA